MTRRRDVTERTSARGEITASDQGAALTIAAGSITASTTSRTLSGMAVKYGVLGRTSKGRLRVRAGALHFPDDIRRVKLTEEHDRSKTRGFLTQLEFLPDGIRASFKVADGTEGDRALAEADPDNPIRDGLSFDVVDALIQGDEIVSATVVAVGQVGIPAYDDGRIDSIAASQTSPTNQGENMTPEQIARLAALRAQATRSAEEEAELVQLAAMENPAPAPVAPAAPAPAPAPVAPAAAAKPAPAPAPVAPATTPALVPAGVPVTASAAVVRETGLTEFARLVAEFLHPSSRGNAEITAALADVTHAQHTAQVSPDSWSGELWSGLEYEAQFLDLYSQGELTNFDGKGWRWGVKPQVGDYAGNKADIPSNTPTTIASTYEAFRIAGGWDIDRKFFDFPDAAFIASFLQAVREHYLMTLDLKVRDYTLANAVFPTGGTVPQNTLIKTVRRVTKHVKRNTRARATFVLVNDDDLDSLLDVTNFDLSAFLDLLNIDPKNWRATPDIASGTVIAGVKQAATVRQLPGASPLRLEMANLSKAGIDEAFYGYAAIEEHHTTGIVKETFTPAP